MLTSVIRRHWHALVRDVLSLGYRVSDMFTTLNWATMVSIVVASPPQSAVRWFLDQGWTREAHMLANMVEGQQGIATLQQPFQRPGLIDRAPDLSNPRAMQTDAYEWDEFTELQNKRYSEAGQKQAAAGQNRSRVW